MYAAEEQDASNEVEERHVFGAKGNKHYVYSRRGKSIFAIDEDEILKSHHVSGGEAPMCTID